MVCALPDGAPTEFYVEFYVLWFEKKDVTINLLLVAWEENLPLVRKNALNISVFRSHKREQWIDFPLHFYSLRTGIMNNRSITEKTKLRELRDIKISSQYTSFQEPYIKNDFADLEQLTLLNSDGVVNKLWNNNVKAVIEGKFVF